MIYNIKSIMIWMEALNDMNHGILIDVFQASNCGT